MLYSNINSNTAVVMDMLIGKETMSISDISDFFIISRQARD